MLSVASSLHFQLPWSLVTGQCLRVRCFVFVVVEFLGTASDFWVAWLWHTLALPPNATATADLTAHDFYFRVIGVNADLDIVAALAEKLLDCSSIDAMSERAVESTATAKTVVTPKGFAWFRVRIPVLVLELSTKEVPIVIDVDFPFRAAKRTLNNRFVAAYDFIDVLYWRELAEFDHTEENLEVIATTVFITRSSRRGGSTQATKF